MIRSSLLVLLVLVPLPAAAVEPGGWGRLGPAGAWKDTIAGTVLNDRLYTVEKTGYLYVTDLSNGTWKQLGKQEFDKTTAMYAAGGNLYTIETDGSLYRVDPRDGSWARVGPAGAWKNTLAGTTHKDFLYTVEASGALFVTDLTTGVWKQIGKQDFANTAGMWAAGDDLYTIEKDGSLYRVNRTDGSWARVGTAGEWKGTRVGTVLKNRLYTVESSGCLYVTQLGSGRWQQLGKQEFGDTIALFAAGDKLFSIEKDGSLYWVSVK